MVQGVKTRRKKGISQYEREKKYQKEINRLIRKAKKTRKLNLDSPEGETDFEKAIRISIQTFKEEQKKRKNAKQRPKKTRKRSPIVELIDLDEEEEEEQKREMERIMKAKKTKKRSIPKKSHIELIDLDDDDDEDEMEKIIKESERLAKENEKKRKEEEEQEIKDALVEFERLDQPQKMKQTKKNEKTSADEQFEKDLEEAIRASELEAAVDTTKKTKMSTTTRTRTRKSPSPSSPEFNKTVRNRSPAAAASSAVPATGLRNQGNTCFANSTVQFLAAIPAYVAILQQTKNLPRIFQHLRDLILTLRETNEPYLDYSIRNVLPRDLANGMQHDIHELLTLRYLDIFILNLDSFLVRTKSQITTIINGERQIVKEFVDRVSNPFLQLSMQNLETSKKALLPLQDICQNYMALITPEQQDIIDLAFTEIGLDIPRDYESAGVQEKHLLVQPLPDNLIVMIGRYYYDRKTNTTIKINKAIDVPMEFDFTFMLGPENTTQIPPYYVRAAIIHHGATANSGHYNTVAWSDIQQGWFLFDDSRVTELSLNEVRRQMQQSVALVFTHTPLGR